MAKHFEQSVITPAKLKQVVKSAITDDNRLKNVMIFGVDEKVTFNEEAIDDTGRVSDILCYIEKGDKLIKSVDKITRIGESSWIPQTSKSLHEEHRISAVSH